LRYDQEAEAVQAKTQAVMLEKAIKDIAAIASEAERQKENAGRQSAVIKESEIPASRIPVPVLP
jgi:hypothetical protein